MAGGIFPLGQELPLPKLAEAANLFQRMANDLSQMRQIWERQFGAVTADEEQRRRDIIVRQNAAHKAINRVAVTGAGVIYDFLTQYGRPVSNGFIVNSGVVALDFYYFNGVETSEPYTLDPDEMFVIQDVRIERLYVSLTDKAGANGEIKGLLR